MAARIFLGLSTLIWLPYGIYCFFEPGSLAEAAGVASTTATGSTELRAMYGGLEIAIGALVGLAVLRPALVRPALLTVAFLTAGLGLARLSGALLDGGFSGYTNAALVLELGSAAVAVALLRRGSGGPAPAAAASTP